MRYTKDIRTAKHKRAVEKQTVERTTKKDEAKADRRFYWDELKRGAKEANAEGVKLEATDKIGELLKALRAEFAEGTPLPSLKPFADGLAWLVYRGYFAFNREYKHLRFSSEFECASQFALFGAVEGVRDALMRLAKNKKPAADVIKFVSTRIKFRIREEYEKALPGYMTRHHKTVARREVAERLGRTGEERTKEAVDALVFAKFVSINTDEDNSDNCCERGCERNYNDLDTEQARAWASPNGLAADDRLDELIRDVAEDEEQQEFLTVSVAVAEPFIGKAFDWKLVNKRVLKHMRRTWPKMTADSVDALRKELQKTLPDLLGIKEIKDEQDRTIHAAGDNPSGWAEGEFGSIILPIRAMPNRCRTGQMVAA